MRKWLTKLWKDGVRYRFLRWTVPLILPHHHIGKNGSGRRKKEKPIEADYKMGHESPLDDEISNDYRTSHLGKFPGKNMGD